MSKNAVRTHCAEIKFWCSDQHALPQSDIGYVHLMLHNFRARCCPAADTSSPPCTVPADNPALRAIADCPKGAEKQCKKYILVAKYAIYEEREVSSDDEGDN